MWENWEMKMTTAEATWLKMNRVNDDWLNDQLKKANDITVVMIKWFYEEQMIKYDLKRYDSALIHTIQKKAKHTSAPQPKGWYLQHTQKVTFQWKFANFLLLGTSFIGMIRCKMAGQVIISTRCQNCNQKQATELDQVSLPIVKPKLGRWFENFDEKVGKNILQLSNSYVNLKFEPRRTM